MTRTKVVDRIAKLLALAAEEGGGTEAERALAAERAQELMHKHRVEQHELAGRAGREALPGIERVLVGKLGLSRVWYGQLLNSIGDGVGVDAVYVPKLAARKYYLVGRPDAIAYVQLVADWIAPQLVRECAKALRERKAEHPEEWSRAGNPGHAAAVSMEFNRSFLEGAVDVIDDRLRAARRKLSGSTDLVRSDRAAMAEFYGDRAPVEEERSVYDGWGDEDGRAAGERADINPGNKVGKAATPELGS